MSIPATPLRVFIIEKQLLFGTAIAQILSSDSDVSVVGLAPERDGAQLAKVRPDVVVVDIDTDDVDSTVDELRSSSPETRICLLSTYSQPEVMQRCLSAGLLCSLSCCSGSKGVCLVQWICPSATLVTGNRRILTFRADAI